MAAEPPDPHGIQDAEAGVERRDDPWCEPRGLPGRELQRQLGQVPVDQQVGRRRDRKSGLRHFLGLVAGDPEHVQGLRPGRHLDRPCVVVEHRLRQRAEEPRVPERDQPLRGRVLEEVAEGDVVLGKAVPQLARMASAGLLHFEQLVQPGEHVGVPVLETLQQPVQQALEAVDQLGELSVGRTGALKGAAVRAHRQPAATGRQPQPEHGRPLVKGHPQIVKDSLDAGGMTALLLNRVQDEPDRALDLSVQMTDQMGESTGLGLLGEQLARGGEPLGGSLANLLAEALDDAFLPRREGRRKLLSRCHADPFSNAPAAARPRSGGPLRAGRRRRLGRALNTPSHESTTPRPPGRLAAILPGQPPEYRFGMTGRRGAGPCQYSVITDATELAGGPRLTAWAAAPTLRGSPGVRDLPEGVAQLGRYGYRPGGYGR